VARTVRPDVGPRVRGSGLRQRRWPIRRNVGPGSVGVAWSIAGTRPPIPV